MAASRGALTFRVTSVCCPVRASGRTQARTSSWQLVHEGRAPVCPPPSRRVHSSKQLAPSPPSPPSPPALRPQGAGLALWEDSVSLCVLVPPGEAEGQLTLVHIPVSRDLWEVLVLGANSSSELCFPLTTVDGRRPDDISVGFLRRQHSCFRSLFEGESCPAPFTHGSRFFCFHCRRPAPSPGGQDRRPDAALCAPETVQRRHAGEDGGGEEKLALMYERLRVELPGFFQRSHDYSMYSADLEFINGLLDMRSRGRVLYQLSLSLWRLLCLCYYAEVRLEVLKLTRHLEDGTIRARWRLRGVPVHSLLLRFYRDKSQLYRTSDAFSTFYLGEDGLIHRHKVEKVMPAQPPVLPRLLPLGALGLRDQRPALNLLPLLLTWLLQTGAPQRDPE